MTIANSSRKNKSRRGVVAGMMNSFGGGGGVIGIGDSSSSSVGSAITSSSKRSTLNNNNYNKIIKTKKNLPFYSKPPKTGRSINSNSRRRLRQRDADQSGDDAMSQKLQRYQETPLLRRQSKMSLSSANESNDSIEEEHSRSYNDTRDDDDGDDFDHDGLLNDRYYEHNDSFSIAEHRKQQKPWHHGTEEQQLEDLHHTETNSKVTVTRRIRRLFAFRKEKNKNDTDTAILNDTIREESADEGLSRNISSKTTIKPRRIGNGLKKQVKRNRDGTKANRSIDIRHVSTITSTDSRNDYHINTSLSEAIDDLLGQQIDEDDIDSTTHSTNSSTLLQMHILEQQQREENKKTVMQLHILEKQQEERKRTMNDMEQDRKESTEKKLTRTGINGSLLYRSEGDEGRQQTANTGNRKTESDDDGDESDRDTDYRSSALPLPSQLRQANETTSGKWSGTGLRIKDNRNEVTVKKNKYLKKSIRYRRNGKSKAVDPPAYGDGGYSVDTDAPENLDSLEAIGTLAGTNNGSDRSKLEHPDTTRSSAFAGSLMTEKISNRACSTTPAMAIAKPSTYNQFTKDNIDALNKEHQERLRTLSQQMQLNQPPKKLSTENRTARMNSPKSLSSDSSLFSSLEDDVKNKSNKKNTNAEITLEGTKVENLDECVEVSALSVRHGDRGLSIHATTARTTTAEKKAEMKRTGALSNQNHNTRNIKDFNGSRRFQYLGYDTDNDNDDSTKGTSQRKMQSEKGLQAAALKSALSRSFGRSSVLDILNSNKIVVTVSSAEWNQNKQKWVYTVTVHRHTLSTTTSLNERSTTPYRDGAASPSYPTATCTRSVSDFVWLERALRYEYHGALLVPPLVLLSQSDNNPSQMPVDADVLKHWLTDVFNGIRGCGEVLLPYSGTLSTASLSKNNKTHDQEYKNQMHDNSLVLNHQEEKKDDRAIITSDSGDNSLVEDVARLTGESALPSSRLCDVFTQSESVETFLYRKSDSLEDVDIFASFGLLGATTTTAAAAAAAVLLNDKCNSPSYCNKLDNNGIFRICNPSLVDDENGDELEPTLLQSLLARAAMISPLDLCVGPAHIHPTISMDQNDKKDDVPKTVIHPKTKYSMIATQNAEERQSVSQQQHRIDDNGRKSLFTNTGLPLDVMACSSRAINTTPSLDVHDSLVDFAPSTVSSLTSMNHGHGNGNELSAGNVGHSEVGVIESTLNNPATSCELAVHSELIEAGKDLMMNYRQTALRVVEKLNALEVEEEKVCAGWKRFSNSLSALFSYEKEVEHARLGGSDGNGKVLRDNMPYRKISKSAVDDALRVMARQKGDRSLLPMRVLKEMLAAYLNDLNTIEPSVDVYTAAMERFVANGYRQTSNGAAKLQQKSSYRTDHHEQAINWITLATAAIDGVKEHALRSFGGKLPSPTNLNEQSDDRTQPVMLWEQEFEERSKLLVDETILRQSITTMCRATPFRLSRMVWHYWNSEGTQCTMQQTASSMLRTKIDCVSQESVSSMLRRHVKEEKDDNTEELELLKKIISIGSSNKLTPETFGKDVTKGILTDTKYYSAERSKEMLRDKALEIGRQRLGRWNASVVSAIMEAIEVDKLPRRVEATTKELKTVKKYAEGLRENLDKCKECINFLSEAISGKNATDGRRRDEGLTAPDDVKETPIEETAKGLRERRIDFFEEFRKLLSASFVQEQDVPPRRSSASRLILLQAGVDTTDPLGWTQSDGQQAIRNRTLDGTAAPNMGKHARQYMEAKDAQILWLLSSLQGLLDEYYQRIDVIEGYVYMELVGIQVEQHFSSKRSFALSAFEKKTDITSAMNIATRKRLPKLIAELQEKLDALGPDVSQVAVREAKEAHLESKSIKALLHTVATRRLTRARECSTERAVQILSFWAKEEENVAKDELQLVRAAISTLENVVIFDKAQLEAVGVPGNVL